MKRQDDFEGLFAMKENGLNSNGWSVFRDCKNPCTSQIRSYLLELMQIKKAAFRRQPL